MNADHEYVYGTELDLYAVRAAVEGVLEAEWILHDSLYWSGDYYVASSPLRRVMIHRNADFEDEAIEDAFPSTWTILRVTGQRIDLPAGFTGRPPIA